MRPRAAILICCLSLAACTSQLTSQVIVSSTSATLVPPTTTPTTTTTTSPVSTTAQPVGPVVGWVAPSGVVLAVTGETGIGVEALTPCGATVTLTSGDPIYEVDVVIDPGHGGPIDTGAVAPTGLSEKELNLRVALAARDFLIDRGVAAVMTRTGDYPIPIRTRVEYAHLLGAEALVSVHHNAPVAPASHIPGVEIFVQQDSSESQRLGGLIYDTAMSALGEFDVDWDRSPDAGVMTVINSDGDDAYGMVRRPEIPSALVELGFIANRAEAELFQTPEYVAVAGRALAESIFQFLNSDGTGAGLVEGRVFNPQPGVGQADCIEPDLEQDLYPGVVDVEMSVEAGLFDFQVTISSPYDSADRYADAFRVVGNDGTVYGVHELTHHHANEQPFDQALEGVEIPEGVTEVTIEARDSVYGWGGVVVTLPIR
jgi:N-acetylmuramoyl-L-alanine amidase